MNISYHQTYLCDRLDMLMSNSKSQYMPEYKTSSTNIYIKKESMIGAQTARTHFEQHIFRAEIEIYFRLFFGSNENRRICFRD